MAMLAACSTTGNSFSSMNLNRIVPGRTTQAQASDILGAQPVSEYCRGNGACIARWAHTFTWVTDAAYLRQELWLQFGPDGTFQRVVKKVNLPYGIHAGSPQSSDAAPPMAGNRQAAAPARPFAVPGPPAPESSARPSPAPSSALLTVPSNTTSPVWTQPMHDTVMTYPVTN
jgi:hypothetical protein